MPRSPTCWTFSTSRMFPGPRRPVRQRLQARQPARRPVSGRNCGPAKSQIAEVEAERSAGRALPEGDTSRYVDVFGVEDLHNRHSSADGSAFQAGYARSDDIVEDDGGAGFTSG